MTKKLTDAEQEFVHLLTEKLPPIIARKKVDVFLGGIVAPNTLKNADSKGTGPEVAYVIGRDVAYKTDSLVAWVVSYFGVNKLTRLVSRL